MGITAAQVRGARAMLAMHQSDLAKAAGIGRSTLATFETGETSPHPSTLARIQTVLEDAGAMFIDTDVATGVLVRMR